MRLWSALYLAIWVVFAEFLLAMIPEGHPWLTYAHAALGVLIVPIAYSNFSAVRATTAPGRIKRIASATFTLAVVTVVLGGPILFNVGTAWPLLFGITVWNLLVLFHVVNAFAIITQMAATAIAYDMWEEREFLQESAAGEVPRPPTRAPARTPSPASSGSPP